MHRELCSDAHGKHGRSCMVVNGFLSRTVGAFKEVFCGTTSLGKFGEAVRNIARDVALA